MKVTLAKSAGFCFGVKRAVDMVYEQIEDAKERPIYTYGPIIHNEEVVKELAEKGVRVIAEDEDLHGLEPGTVIIRSHGVGRKVKEDLENAGFTIVDATCPFVQKIHRYVAKYAEEGYFVRRKREPPGSTGDRRLDAKRFLCRYFYAAGS